MKKNIRYGVVNSVEREKYEKEYQIAYGYELMTYNKNEAIFYAKGLNNPDYIVEEIYNTSETNNNKEEIFQSGNF